MIEYLEQLSLHALKLVLILGGVCCFSELAFAEPAEPIDERPLFYNYSSPWRKSSLGLETILQEANRLFNTQDYTAALDLYQQILKQCLHHEVYRCVGEAQLQLGEIFRKLQQYDEALEYYQQALATLRKLEHSDAPTLLGSTLNGLALVNRSAGNYSQAQNFFEQAIALHRQEGNRLEESFVLNNLGLMQQDQSAYFAALDFFQVAADNFASLERFEYQQIVLGNIGATYVSLGQYEKALSIFEEALVLSRSTRNVWQEGFLLHNIGLVYIQTQSYEQALQFTQEALDLRQAIGDPSGKSVSLNNIAYIYLQLGDYPQALTNANAAFEIAVTHGDRLNQSSSLDTLGEIYAHSELWESAIKSYLQAIAMRQASGDLQGQAVTLQHLGQLYRAQKQTELAIIFHKQAVNLIERIRDDLQPLPLEQQRAYADTVTDLYRDLADLLLQQNRVLEAQRVIDLLKVQELDEVLRGVRGEDSTVSGIPLTPEERQLITEGQQIFQQAAAIAGELSELRQILGEDRTADQNARIFELENQQSTLLSNFLTFVDSDEVQALIAQLEEKGQRGDLVLELESDEFINLRNNLDEIGNAALLYPVILENRIELVLVNSSGPPVHYPIPVDEATLRDTVFDFREALRDKTSNPQPLAQQLYDWVIPPELAAVLDEQDINTLLYAPDGILRYVPLAALHDGNRWLIQRYRINHITAASLTDLNLQDDPEPLVLAGAFSQGSHASPAGNLAGLPYAGIEVENLTQLLPSSDPLFDDQFTLAGTAPLMNDHTIVHFATHAAFLIDNPLESFILFGNGDRLTLQDLKGWRGRFSNVDLVVLSACETGVGEVRDADGQEILGFGYLMQAAGASAAMASLWSVSDGGTQILMTRFYDYLSQGLSKAEALQQAQLSLITGDKVSIEDVERIIGQRQTTEEAERVYQQLSHPYYWAPFILIGNGL